MRRQLPIHYPGGNVVTSCSRGRGQPGLGGVGLAPGVFESPPSLKSLRSSHVVISPHSSGVSPLVVQMHSISLEN